MLQMRNSLAIYSELLRENTNMIWFVEYVRFDSLIYQYLCN